MHFLHWRFCTQTRSCGVVFLPVTVAAMANKQLPASIEPEKWRTGAWDWDRCLACSRSAASTHRCVTRTGAPPEEAMDLLDALGESAALWRCLRKHLASADVIFVLNTLKDQSTWPILKRTDDEKERRAYLHLWRDCKHYDPELGACRKGSTKISSSSAGRGWVRGSRRFSLSIERVSFLAALASLQM